MGEVVRVDGGRVEAWKVVLLLLLLLFIIYLFF